jgi:hypothetical protein
VNFATPKFNKAVDDLKALCGPSHTQLFRFGQFYVTNRTMEDLFHQVERNLSDNLRFILGPAEQLANTIEFFRKKLLGVAPLDVNVPLITATLDLIESNGDMAAIRAMLVTTKQDQANAQAEFNDIWSDTRIPEAPRWYGTATLGKAQAAFRLEKDKCFTVLRSFAAKLLKKRADAHVSRSSTLGESVVGGAQPKQTAAGVPASPGVAEIIPRETLDYAQPAALDAAAKRMRAALDERGFIHCGVLSGARHERSTFPNPEHHILVIAYDTIDGQDAFLFWDPDAAHTNIKSTGWKAGFGVLFSRPGRLCTGVDDADLANIERTKDALFEGDHLLDPPTLDNRRHSYQVYSLITLPLPVRLKLHVKVLSTPSHASVDDMLNRAVEAYAANGLELLELSRETFDTPGTDLDRFQMPFVGADPAGEATADVTDLHTTLRQARDFGVTPAPTELVVAFVRSTVPAQRGSSLYPLEQPGIIISSSLATQWTLAYEIGRVLGLVTSMAPGELTFPSTASIGDDGVELLSDDNREALLTSPLVEA